MADPNSYAKIIAKAWADQGFHDRLVANPAKTLTDEGWTIHPSVTIQIVDNSEKHTLSLGLPPKPQGLGEEQLRHGAEQIPCCTCVPCAQVIPCC